MRAKIINPEETFLEDRDNLLLLRMRNKVLPKVSAYQNIPELVLSWIPMAKDNEGKETLEQPDCPPAVSGT